jgi:cytoskeletal protein CcmA (bactofilin family)
MRDPRAVVCKEQREKMPATETLETGVSLTEELMDIPHVPDMVVGADVELKGEIEFEKFLRVEGTFEGLLHCDLGSVYVGPQGLVIADLLNCDIVIVEGTVRGNIQARHLIIRGDATVEGDVEGDSVEMGPHVQLTGQMRVTAKGKAKNSRCVRVSVCTHSLTHSLTHTLTHSPTHSLTHPLTHSPTHPAPRGRVKSTSVRYC